MLCGSCFRDNTLAAALMAKGHDVRLVPIYTPTRTDEDNVSDSRIFFGGISVYLEQQSALFRQMPGLIDRLWDSRWALTLAARRSIPTDPRLLGELTVSVLRGEQGLQQKEVAKLVGWLSQQSRPDVVTLPNSLMVGLAHPIKRALNVPVCCTLQGEELFLDGLEAPYRTEALELIRANVRHVDLFIGVSEYCASFMTGYLQIPPEKMRVVPLGVNLEGYPESARSRGKPPVIGFLARIAPEKGLHVLCDAFHRLRQRGDLANVRLEAAGYLGPEHQAYLQGIERQMAERGLAGAFAYLGEVTREEKIAFLSRIDVMSMPTPYDEPKGLSVLEAMACGVPVVQPRRGSFTEMIERTGGGLLVAPDDVDALAAALARILTSRPLAQQLGRAGAQAVRTHYSAERMADRALQVFEEACSRSSMSPSRTRPPAVGSTSFPESPSR